MKKKLLDRMLPPSVPSAFLAVFLAASLSAPVVILGAAGCSHSSTKAAPTRPAGREAAQATAARNASHTAMAPNETRSARTGARTGRTEAETSRKNASPQTDAARGASLPAMPVTHKVVSGGDRPNHGVLQSLCSRPGLTKVRSWGLLPLDKTRYVGVVAAIPASSTEERFFVAEIRKVPKGWALSWMVKLRTTKKPATVETRGAASLFLKDYDKDGKKELLVRYRYNTYPEAAIGSASRTDMTILNLSESGPPKEARSMNLHNVYGAETKLSWKTKISFKDLNGDGHPDIVATRTEWQTKEDKQGKWKRRSSHAKFYLVWCPKNDQFYSVKPTPIRPGFSSCP